ncbi:hypothetical protein C0991_008391 [Blastosporella zonata]|nr:hypothetical protein C0991_008391 [Blastosporella zonata]
MKAARFYGPGDVRIEDIGEPVASKGQVKVKVSSQFRYVLQNADFYEPCVGYLCSEQEWQYVVHYKGNQIFDALSSVCGSDLHAYLSPIPKYANSVPNELTGETVPITLGHEFSGTIVALGADVDANKWGIGTNVVMHAHPEAETYAHHATLSYAMSNLPPLSLEYQFLQGICGWGGGLSGFIAVDVKYLHVLPAGVSLEIGACIEPLAVAWHAIKRSGITEGKSVLILGAGPIGLFTLKILRSFYPSAIIVVSEISVLRRQQALKHGATLSVDPTNADIPQAVLQATGGTGVDVVFNAAGTQASMDAALLSVRPRGTVVNIAIWEKAPTVDFNLVTFKEILLTGQPDSILPTLEISECWWYRVNGL